MDALFPWTPRQVRKTAIEHARGEKETSRRAAAEAARVEEEIRSLAERNHFAWSIAEQIISRHRQGGGAALCTTPTSSSPSRSC